jgi:argininosuccinate lyase
MTEKRDRRAATGARSWGGRFTGSLADAMLRLSASIDVDRALAEDDIHGSMAHARGLFLAGVLSAQELETMLRGLETVLDDVRQGNMKWDNALEDVHMNVEARLTEVVGPLGGKLHTGRSRNDQVATDLRLWARRTAGDIGDAIDRLSRVLVDRAEEHLTTLMPGYTHLQRAQPVRLAHHLLAWFEMLRRDRGRLDDARRRINELPLGAGAIAGTTFDIDRHQLAAELEFDRPMANSIDATASRDFLTELAAALAITAVHLSRMGEEIVLWSSKEFGFIELDDAFATGSSMMPQKKNPDAAELVRGKSARVIGNLVALLTLQKGLPLGYNRDLQEDKTPIFDSAAAVAVSLEAMAGALSSATFRVDRMRAALDDGYVTATEIADFLAARGVPFREAHEITGRMVREAMARGVPLHELPVAVMRGFHPAIDDKVLEVLDPEVAIERRTGFGGPSAAQVQKAILTAREALRR